MPPFIEGRIVSRRFYDTVVGPLLATHVPQIAYAAAHIGAGSDVLGFDTELSTDHDWGPRMHLFVQPEDMEHAAAINDLLRRELPLAFLNYPVRIDPTDETSDHRIIITTVHSFLHHQLQYDDSVPLTVADWLSFTSQHLRELTAGTIHYDPAGELASVLAQFAAYPRDVWLYLMACGWHRIAQEEHLMPRAGSVGDELGSAVIGSRLVRDVMQLCFLMEQQYAPYPKWFGTAWKRLACAEEMEPLLLRAQQATSWRERETAFVAVYSALARLHNALGVTEALDEKVTHFFNRPFRVISGDRFADALCREIADPDMQQIASHSFIGGVDQWSDNTDLRSNSRWRPVIRSFYES